MRVVVERRDDPRCKPALDVLASACRAMGHTTIRWRNRGRLPKCGSAVVWNGTHRVYDAVHEAGVPLVYVELGWLPQDGTFQIDSRGINADASWADAPLSAAGREGTGLCSKHRTSRSRPVSSKTRASGPKRR